MKKILNVLTFVLMSILVGHVFANILEVNPFFTTGILLAIGSIPLKTEGILMSNYASCIWTGKSNIGGNHPTVYFAPLSDIVNFPELPANPASAEEETTLESVTGFTMAALKFFLKIEATLETIQVIDEPQGDIDGKSFIHKGTFFYPGESAEIHAFAKLVNNDRMAFIFNSPDGKRRVIGSKTFPAHVTVKLDSGMKTADRKGATIEVVSYGICPAPFYTGTIPLV